MRPASVLCGLALCAITMLSWTALSAATPDVPAPAVGTPPTATNPDNPEVVPDEAAASPFSGSWSVSTASRYIFQGFDYSDGKAVFNPELDLSAGPISAKVWANHNLDTGFSDEFDFSVLHEWSTKVLSFSTGYTYLRYPHRDGWNPSQEFYVDLSRAGALNPSLSVHYDFDSGTGTYSTLGFSHELPSSFGTVSLGTNLFYQSGYYDLTGIPSVEANMNFSKSFGKISVTPSLSRFFTWENGDFRAANTLPAQWLFSVSVGSEF